MGLVVALIIATAEFSTRASAFSVTITVTTAADNTTADGQCSLREALTNANNHNVTYADCTTGVGSAVIIFASNLGTATIGLTSPFPAISDTNGLTINGGGRITISGNDQYQVFVLNANVPLTLDGLTVAHGLSPEGGGAYVSSGALLTILNSTFSNNNAAAPANGGIGGGVDNLGGLVITNSTFSLNHANGTGGGVTQHTGTLTITNSTFSGNTAGYGGGLRSLGGVSNITKSSFSGNNASSYGGGIDHYGGTLTITGSTFSTNTAGVGGAIYNLATLVLANNTFYTNSANFGGALYNDQIGSNVGNTTILNSTFSKNTAIFADFGVISNGGVLSLSNTLIANSGVGSGDCVNSGTVNNSTNNLIENAANTCGLANGVNGNITGVNPDLGPGSGSPVYLPLNGGSAAINAGDDGKCAAAPVNNNSQNGLRRPDGAHCDIGAYEADVTPPAVLSIVRADPNPTNSATVAFTVTFSEPVYGVSTNDFTLTHPGITGGFVAPLSTTSGTTLTVIANTGSGSGTLRLDVIDRDTILDTANLYLGGAGLGNGSFTAGQVYTVNRGGPGPYRTYLAQLLR